MEGEQNVSPADHMNKVIVKLDCFLHSYLENCKLFLFACGGRQKIHSKFVLVSILDCNCLVWLRNHNSNGRNNNEWVEITF